MNNTIWMLYLSPDLRRAEERRHREELARMWGGPLVPGLGSALRRGLAHRSGRPSRRHVRAA